MIDRMYDIIKDDSFRSDDQKDNFEKQNLKVNLNAVTLLIVCVNQVYTNILSMGDELIQAKLENRKRNHKKFYISCAKLYHMDSFLWSAMHTNHDDIFYRSESEDEW